MNWRCRIGIHDWRYTDGYITIPEERRVTGRFYAKRCVRCDKRTRREVKLKRP